jgi:hypothetical protein
MKITLAEWAAKHYSRPPSHLVLAKWRRLGQIYPPPERVGHEWFVQENAERVVGQPLPNLAGKLRRAA